MTDSALHFLLSVIDLPRIFIPQFCAPMSLAIFVSVSLSVLVCPVLWSCLGAKRGGDRIDLLHHEFFIQRQLINVLTPDARQLVFF